MGQISSIQSIISICSSVTSAVILEMASLTLIYLGVAMHDGNKAEK